MTPETAIRDRRGSAASLILKDGGVLTGLGDRETSLAAVRDAKAVLKLVRALQGRILTPDGQWLTGTPGPRGRPDHVPARGHRSGPHAAAGLRRPARSRRRRRRRHGRRRGRSRPPSPASTCATAPPPSARRRSPGRLDDLRATVDGRGQRARPTTPDRARPARGPPGGARSSPRLEARCPAPPPDARTRHGPLLETLLDAGDVAIVTLAPELPGSLGVGAPARRAAGVRVSLGHSACDQVTAVAAFAAGASAA